ncbi:solute carrier family 2, facilitated glucose transporter member 1 isoform X2 [Cephus cinctus]|uniref:Solute carrier family 2, facilitated glucose transporter member 1 isoform X2 n=1 Tax=Cephus cinctus TaxID=211228 RepID=A0AAJ7CCH9_CEPCN|nr:solute carrier family 2, facilitated glucose transporter member 1 isoform X2 [Cephus cinctus]
MLADADATTLCLEGPGVTILPGETRSANNAKNSTIITGRWTPMLALAGATCCLGSAVPAGYNIGVMNNPAQIMLAFCNASIQRRYGEEISYDSLHIVWAAIVSIFLIGGVSGSLTASSVADKLGRRGALGIGNVCGIIGAVLFLASKPFDSIELLMLGRLVVGLSGGLATSLLPMYMTEVAPLNLRGAVGVLCQLGITCGVLLAQIAGLDSVLGTENYWHVMLASFAPLCILAVLVTFILPESPKFLFVVKGYEQRALKELTRLRGVNLNHLLNEVTLLRQESTASSSTDNWTISRVIREPSLRLSLILVCALQCGQQLSGINAVFFYSSSIFMEAGLNLKESQYATLGTGIINIGMALISVPFMTLFGRRTLLLNSCYTSMACLIVLCISIININSSPIMPWICIVAILAYVLFYGLGLGPIPYFIGSELFDVGPRPVAMALGSVSNWGGNFLVAMTFPSLQRAVGPYSFLAYTACILLLALFSRRYLPETRGRNTIDIAATMTRGFKSQPNDPNHI